MFVAIEHVCAMNIIDGRMTLFCMGDQITHINDTRVTSIQKISTSAIVGSIEMGKDILFKVKRPKKQEHG